MDRMTDRDQIHSLRMGWRNIYPVVLLCQFFACGGNSFRWYLPTIPVVLMCLFFVAVGNSFWLLRLVFWLWREKGFRCYFITYHTSCVVVSVFCQWWEIVFGYSVSKKDSYLVSLIERQTASKCVYFVRSNTLFTLCLSTLYLSLVPERSVIFLSAFCEGIYQIPMLYPESSVDFKKR